MIEISYIFIAVACLIMGSLVCTTYRAYQLSTLPSGISITPQNTTFSFDLHRVVLKYDYPQIIHIIFKNLWVIPGLFYFLNPRIWIDMLKLLKNHAVVEKYIMFLSNKYPYLKKFVPVAIEISNAQKPNRKTIEIIRQLKKGGYTIHLFSNIGLETFNDLTPQFPDVFSLFDDIKVTSPDSDYLAKPHPDAFASYLKELNGDKKQVIFIDDKTRNIKVAQSCGIIGLLFISAWWLELTLRQHKVL